MHQYYEIADTTRRTDVEQPFTEKRTNSPTGTAKTYYIVATYMLAVVDLRAFGKNLRQSASDQRERFHNRRKHHQNIKT